MSFSNKFEINNFKGILLSQCDMGFLKDICKIDTNKYQYIYRISNKWTSHYLFINNENYRYIICGYNIPIHRDFEGTFIDIDGLTNDINIKIKNDI
jgi:hypothetical protein